MKGSVFISPGAAVLLAMMTPAVPSPPDGRPGVTVDGGYVGSGTCIACHPDQYDSWSGSYHRTMTTVPSAATVKPSFDEVEVAGVHGRPMQLRRTGDRYWATFDDPDTPSEPTRITREVALVTGSHHQQVFWYATGQDKLLGQLPGAYLIDEARWIPRRMAVLHPPSDQVFSETGHWNAVCLSCHATSGRPELDQPFGSVPLARQGVNTRVGEFGIGCEACHGPGASHVADARRPWSRYAAHLGRPLGAAMAHPGKMSGERSAEVCGQCHSVWEFADGRAERAANSAGLPYRPGDVLRATRFLVQPRVNGHSRPLQRLLEVDPGFVDDAFWPDGTVRVTGREYNGLIESACFREAVHDDRRMGCQTCHSLHKTGDDRRSTAAWADDQLRPEALDGRTICRDCHAAVTATPAALQAHTRHAPASTGSDCYNCHMPRTTYGLLKTTRSHTVSSPRISDDRRSAPNACNLCHLDRTERWAAEQLSAWQVARPASLDDDRESLAAGAVWALTGDAGSRAVTAAAMGWVPAQEASGTAWMVPVLAQLLDDPYDAVRFVAQRSLRQLPSQGAVTDVLTAPAAERRKTQVAVMRQWDRAGRVVGSEAWSPARRQAVLLQGDGSLNIPAFLALLRRRDDRTVLLRE